MPEGPEVKLFVEKLNQNYRYYMIKSVNVLSGRYTKKPIPRLSTLLGKEIKVFDCKGKFIWIDLDDVIVFNTLGMTGSWSREKSKHSRIEFNFYENDTLYFNDIRNFGTFQVKNRDDLNKKLKSIGPDMLSNPPLDFVKILRKYNNKNICEVLMNQKIISGIGNYIKSESLWHSKINPFAPVRFLTDENLKELEKSIIYVINKSYNSSGATIKSYYNFDGESGSASNFFEVYGKKFDKFGMKVKKEQTPDKRNTHWVKNRQIYGEPNMNEDINICDTIFFKYIHSNEELRYGIVLDVKKDLNFGSIVKIICDNKIEHIPYSLIQFEKVNK
tara:strand:+ start:893 stop:1882 length:990 start_codon:yes stop_codon:yes gene_type:complete